MSIINLLLCLLHTVQYFFTVCFFIFLSAVFAVVLKIVLKTRQQLFKFVPYLLPLQSSYIPKITRNDMLSNCALDMA